MRKKLLSLTLVLFTNVYFIKAQDTCESPEETLEDLNSITKCTITKTEKRTLKGNKSEQLSVKISSSTRYLKKRIKEKELVSGLDNDIASAAVEVNSNSEIKNSLDLKENDLNKIKIKYSAKQLNEALEFDDLDQIPLFKSCENKDRLENSNCFNENMMAHIQKHFRYPNKAVLGKIQGNVWVRFVIDEEGKVSNLKAISSKSTSILKEEAIRVVSKLTSFKPAIKKGKKVLAKYGFPINFSLEE